MRLRPYIATKDYHYITQWIDDDRVHALWCANLIPYPLQRNVLTNFWNKMRSSGQTDERSIDQSANDNDNIFGIIL